MKPIPKIEIAIDNIMPDKGIIIGWATRDALNDIKTFGIIFPHPLSGEDGFWLKVDGRYDFNEVLEYIKNYANLA